MFRRAMSRNHNARNTAFVPGDRLLSGGLRHVPFRVLPARPCNQGAQTHGLLLMSTPAAHKPMGRHHRSWN